MTRTWQSHVVEVLRDIREEVKALEPYETTKIFLERDEVMHILDRWVENAETDERVERRLERHIIEQIVENHES